MSNLEKPLLSSAQEGAEGSDSSIGAHILSSLASGKGDPKLVTEAIRQINIRGGRGSKGEPSEISESIKKAQEDAVRIDHTLAKLKNEKEGLLLELADFRVKERQLVEAGRTEEVTALRKAMVKTQEKIDAANGVLPETTSTEDHKKVQSIISEFYAEKHKKERAVEKIKQAEEKLETAPGDGRAQGDYNRGETEKFRAEERLAEVAHQAELILKNETPNPARDEGVHHTNAETIAEKEYISKRNSERIAPGIFGHKKEGEEMQKEMDELAVKTGEQSMQSVVEPATLSETGFEEKTMKEELPPLEFTLEPTEDEKSLAHVEERRKEIEAKKPLQSAYDMTMDRIWKENEEKRNTVLGKIPEADIEHDIETHNALLPLQIEEDVVGTPREGQEAAFEKFEALAEKEIVTKEQVLANISLLDEGVEARAEKAGMNKDILRRVGDTWNKIPTRYKLLISAGMIATGLAVETAAAAATIAAVGAGIRFVGGTGLFATFDGMLEKSAQKNGVERSALAVGRDKFAAAGLAIVIAGVLPNMARDYAVEHGFFQKIADFFGSFGPNHTEVVPPVESGEYIQIAKAGDSVWKMAEHIVDEKFPQLEAGERTYITDAIKDRIVKSPESYGLTDTNNIAIGKGVDFGGIFNDKEFMDNALSSAKNLTPEQVTNIQNYGNETPARTVSSEKFLNEQLHTTFSPEETGNVVPPNVIPTPEQTTPTSFIKSEILPGNVAEFAQIETSAFAILNNDMDVLFGGPKFLWFGHTDGLNSINWKDPQVGFAGKTVTEIMSSTPSAVLVEGGRTFGVENFEATSKMKEYLSNVTHMTGVNPNSNEKVADFIHRASVAKLSK